MNLVHRLTDNLDVANNCILNLLVLLESFKVWQGLKVPVARSMASAMCSR